MRRAKVAGFLIACLGLLSTGPVLASLYEKGGGNGTDARAMGMAGAYVAVANDESAMWWNPAGLGLTRSWTIGGSWESVYADRIRSGVLATAFPLPAETGAGLFWQHDTYPQGTPIQADLLALGGSLPLTRDKRLRLGATWKQMFGNLAVPEGNFQGTGMDFGLRYSSALPQEDEHWAIGFRLKDIASRLQWQTGTDEELPQSYVLGGMWRYDRAGLAALDLEYDRSAVDPQDQTRLLRLGTERWFWDHAGLRAGYLLDDRGTHAFSLGAGTRWFGVELDYALLTDMSGLGMSHRLTLRCDLTGRGVPTPQPTLAPTPMPTAMATLAATPAVTPTTAMVQPIPRLTLLSDEERFAPNLHGMPHDAQFRARWSGDVNSVSSWRFKVQDAQGGTVREEVGSGLASAWTWNGRDEQGAVCADGEYQVQVELLDARGEVLVQDGTRIQLATQPARGNLRVSVKTGSVLKGQLLDPIAIHLTPRDGAFETWEVSIRPKGAERSAVARWSGTTEGPRVLSWRGSESATPLASGDYLVTLTFTDGAGLTGEERAQVSLSEFKPEVGLWVDQSVLLAGSRLEGKVNFDLAAQPAEQVRSWELKIYQVETGATLYSQKKNGALQETLHWSVVEQGERPQYSGQYLKVRLSVTFGSGAAVETAETPLTLDIVRQAGEMMSLPMATVWFKPGSADIPLESFRSLRTAAQAIKQYATRYQVQVRGYCDRDEAAGAELDLAWRRVFKVRDHLVQKGGIPVGAIALVGYGARTLVTVDPSPQGRGKNRRVEITVTVRSAGN